MSEAGGNPSHTSHGFVEKSELTQHGPTVIANPLAGELVVGIERKDAAKRELDAASGRGQASPCAEMRTADDDLHHYTLGCNVTVLHLDCRVRQRAQQLGVVRAHSVAADAVVAPWPIVVSCVWTERRHHSVNVEGVLAPDVFIDDCGACAVSLGQRHFVGSDAGLGGLLRSERTCREVTALPIASEDPKVAQNGNLERLLCKLRAPAHLERPCVEADNITAGGTGDGTDSFVGIEDELAYEQGGAR
jgi:hypothetical protein